MSEASPVERKASPVGRGWRYLEPKQKLVLLGSGAVAIAMGAMAISAWRHSREHDIVPPPVKQTNQSEPFSPPRFPKVTPVATGALIQPPAGAGTFTRTDPNKAARESDILGASSSSGNETHGRGVSRADASTSGPSAQTALGERLTPTELAGSRAIELPNPEFTIGAGRLIPCNKQTAIDTTFPGFVTANLPHAVKGNAGHVDLLDAGSTVFGSMEKGIINGLDRQFVLWHHITTPPLYDRMGASHQYRVQVNSPDADELGQTGEAGDVNRHLLRKLGTVVGISVLTGGIQAGIASVQPKGSSNLNIGGAGGLEQLPSQLLAAQINIPDVMHINQGTACSIYVARDLDLSTIYSLHKK